MDFILNKYFLLSMGIFIPFIMMIIRWKPLQERSSTKIFSAYIILDVIAWFLSVFLAFSGIRNLIVSNIHGVFELALLGLFYIYIFNFKNKKPYYYMLLGLVAINVVGVFTVQNSEYNILADIAVNFLFIICALLFYFKLMHEHVIDNMLNYPIFYFNTGILLYFSCSIFITIFSNYFLDLSNQANIALWTFHSIINLICFIIFAVGIYKCRLRAKY